MLLISKNYVYHPVAKIAVAVVLYGLYVAYSSLHQANRVQINEDFFTFWIQNLVQFPYTLTYVGTLMYYVEGKILK